MILGANLISLNALAQSFNESFNEEELLISDDDSNNSSGLDFTDYITGEFGLISGGNAGVSRRSTIYNVGVDIPWEWGRFYATYGGVEFDLKITQELRDSVKNNPYEETDLPAERSIKTSTKDVDLREAFVQLNLNSNVTVEAGRQRNAWGQFELLSPATIMLPFNANFTSIVPNKLDLLYAQDQAVVKVFPTSKVEIGLYMIDGLATDSSANENALLWLKPFNRLEGGRNGKLVSIGENEEIDFTVKEEYADNQSAFRLVFYPNWGTIGFTYHQGYNAFVPLLRTPVVTGNSNPENDDGTVNVVASAYLDAENSYLYYAEGTNTAIEISVPVGKFTWRLETAMVESYSGVDEFGGNIYLLADNAQNGFSSGLAQAFIDEARKGNQNDPITGTALFKSRTTTSAVGFIYQGNEWTFNVSAIMLGTPEPTEERGKRMLELYKQLEAETGNDNGASFTSVPLVNGFRNRGDEDQHLYGFALGAVGVGFGVGAIYGYKITEDININTSLGYHAIKYQ